MYYDFLAVNWLVIIVLVGVAADAEARQGAAGACLRQTERDRPERANNDHPTHITQSPSSSPAHRHARVWVLRSRLGF